jgi:hypothetical protein
VLKKAPEAVVQYLTFTPPMHELLRYVSFSLLDAPLILSVDILSRRPRFAVLQTQ